jgi:tRNA A22 N-methylase
MIEIQLQKDTKMWVIGGVGGENMTTLLGLALLDFGI